MKKSDLAMWIKAYEGYRCHPYLCPAGKLTVGIGRNLESNGISPKEALYLLNNDIESIENQLNRFEWYKNAQEGVKCALVNMAFQMGVNGLLGFEDMIKALEDGNYSKAAIEALDSDWGRKYKNRANDVANIIRDGK